MRDKLNTFISNTMGQFIEISSWEASRQCMDLAYLWTFCLNIPKSTIQHGAAYQVFTEANDTTRQYFDLFINEIQFIPQAGDLFIIGKTSSYPYGHIGIVIEATQTKMKCFEQNYPTGTNAHIQDRSYTGVIGFLRPKLNSESPVPSWLTTLLQERGLTLNNESEIRIIFEKAKKYEDDIKALEEKLKTANEALADRSLEVSSLIGKVQNLESKVEELEALYGQAKSERDSFEWSNKTLEIKVDENEKALDVYKSELEALKIDYSKLQEQSIEGLTKWELIKFIFKRR